MENAITLCLNPILGKANNKKRIMVIENDTEIRHILSLLFEDEGWDFIMFNETVDIVPLVKQYQPDLVLLDFRLPLVNGGELCLQIKSDQQTYSIPVIIFSAAPRTFLSVRDYHHDLFMPKPFKLDELIAKMRELIFLKKLNPISYRYKKSC